MQEELKHSNFFLPPPALQLPINLPSPLPELVAFFLVQFELPAKMLQIPQNMHEMGSENDGSAWQFVLKNKWSRVSLQEGKRRRRQVAKLCYVFLSFDATPKDPQLEVCPSHDSLTRVIEINW